MPKTSLADLEALLRRAELALTPAEVASVHIGWGHAETMLARLREPLLPRAAEPANIFRPEAYFP